MKIFKFKVATALFFISYLCTLCFVASQTTNVIRELTDDDYNEIRNLYRIEEKKEEKFYQEVALHPERFDKNKDKSISRFELKQAIKYLIFPKSKVETKNLSKAVADKVIANIDTFAEDKPEYMTYRQFSYIIINLKAETFVQSAYFDELASHEKAGLEFEGDL